MNAIETKPNFTGTSIMDCPVNDLLDVLANYMQRFDNYEQILYDKGFIEVIDEVSTCYDQLDQYFFKAKKDNVLSIDDRNSIRLLIKGTEKLVVSTLLN